ncbi:MAG: hypothetical protein QOC95_1659 [Thermoleophilaceae bacterium]|nr:hypothetical protein [Thermoleophilaceae bacterium]
MSYDPRAYRASDADREAAADRLRHASVEGRIDSDELEQRLAEVYRSVTVSELDRLLLDVLPPPPPPPPAPMYQQYYQPVPYGPQPTTNGLAVASLVAGVFWVMWLGSVLAVVFGHVALNQIEKSDGRESGRGIAIAGLVLGYIGVAVLVVVLLTVAAA